MTLRNQVIQYLCLQRKIHRANTEEITSMRKLSYTVYREEIWTFLKQLIERG